MKKVRIICQFVVRFFVQINLFLENAALQENRNMYDRVIILEHYFCSSMTKNMDYMVNEEIAINSTYSEGESAMKSSTKSNEINSIVKLVQGSTKSLAIQVGGKPPFLIDFDSTRTFIYMDEDEKHVYLYKFCPNVTEGNSYKKWSMVNIWNKAKLKFILSIENIWPGCPHTIFNQTLIFGSFNEFE